MEKQKIEIGSYIIEYPCDEHGDYFKVTDINFTYNPVKYICGGDLETLLSALWIDNTFKPTNSGVSDE